ncbi:MAG: 16S rRNA (uracil(1498)-N(3))-methyltransferase [Hyphomicrobiales bacterium]|nr:16S rRNA (uracil(1498)-N(3))-methyltransferase [Hyphomicrobiales bacterium]MDE2113637.1 16S rRNA (uracil(1498)-N(3))-methyltransferase [Hyphomicrobiales bacterium]
MNDKTLPRYRLFVTPDLSERRVIDLDSGQVNYLIHVLRLKPGAEILVFNGSSGEWRAQIQPGPRKSARLEIVAQTRPQPEFRPLHYYFAPLKMARLDYMVQKAVEMGASHLHPIQTAYTQMVHINPARLRANAIEAAEQCGILSLPEIAPIKPMMAALQAAPADQWLVFCDEAAPLDNALQTLAAAPPGSHAGVVIGPEGGFSPAERDAILHLPRVLRISLGARILRADTAAVAALALVQAGWPNASTIS